MDEQVTFVRGLYEAFAAGDVPSVLAALDPDVDWREAEHSPLWTGSPAIGVDAVVQDVFARLGELFGSTFRIQVDRTHHDGGTVVVEGRYHGTVQSTGRELSAQMAHVWDVDGGRVLRFQQYTDTWSWAEATGLAPSPSTSAV